MKPSHITSPKNKVSLWRIFTIFLILGLTSFGGPVAHIGYFRQTFVTRLAWLTERAYADLVALCQFLPGPASSQIGIALGWSQGGYIGALLAWLGFTLPSALFLILCAQGLSLYSEILPSGLLHGLKLAAVAVVIQAVWGMGRHLCRGLTKIAMMLVAATMTVTLPSSLTQLGIIVVSGIFGSLIFHTTSSSKESYLPIQSSRCAATAWLVLMLSLLVIFPILRHYYPSQLTLMLDAFYRTGTLVFGGGHTILPLLQAELVSTGVISSDRFLAGYGLTQAVPGPLFTFSAFLGASVGHGFNSWFYALACLLALFSSSFFLVFGVLPFWQHVQHYPRLQSALSGINASVVGLLLGTLYTPMLTHTVNDLFDIVFVILGLAGLMWKKLPPWLIVLVAGGGGWLWF